MDTDELRKEFQSFFDKLKAFEERARKLANQNLADIAASAHGRIKQLIDHPDTKLMADTQKDPSVQQDGTPRTDRAPAPWGSNVTGKDLHERERGHGADWTGLSQAERDRYDQRARDEAQKQRDQAGGGTQTNQQKPAAPADAQNVGGPDRGKSDTYAPGDPRFNQPNRDFRNPDAVDLNPDGTLRQAPNSISSRPDVRSSSGGEK